LDCDLWDMQLVINWRKLRQIIKKKTLYSVESMAGYVRMKMRSWNGIFNMGWMGDYD
jgi:hypothetical protein